MDILRVKLVQQKPNDEIQALLQVIQILLFLLEPEVGLCKAM
jgi:hypothetical protein